MDYQILLYYKYTKISDPEKFKVLQEKICTDLNLKGRIIIANEGINGTVEGLKKETEKYIQLLSKIPGFSDTHFKKSIGTSKAFPKLSIKTRKDLVSSSLNLHLDPNEISGKYLLPEELYSWFKSGKQFYIVDMRNDYEHSV